MTDLHERLDDLVADVPAYVVPDARRAWAIGARRRLTRRIGAGVAVVVLVALAAGLAGVLPRSADVPPADGESRGVDGYPSRIEKPWFLRDLPERPGAIAGLVKTETDMLAVGPTGTMWRLPQEDTVAGYPVAVSADGRRIAYLADHDTFALRDLAAGTTTVAHDVGDGTYRAGREDRDTDHAYALSMQAPAFFSPDGRTVAALGAPTEPTDARNGVLLIGVDGSASFVEGPRSVGPKGAVWPAGWTPSGDLVWLDSDFATSGRPSWLGVVVTDTSGRRLKALDVTIPPRLRGVSQWTAAVSPDGELLALTTEESARTFLMSLRTGKQVGEVSSSNYSTLCPISWAGSTPRPPWAGAEDTLVVDERHRPLVQTDPGLHALCAIWANDALSGERHRGLGATMFGTGDGWLSWHWQETLAGVIASTLALAVTAVLLLRRRRTAHQG